MPVVGLCASHTPLKDVHHPGAEAAAEVAGCFAELQRWVQAWAPERLVIFGPDHFNGFFYRLMPPFCVGVAAESVGDWNTRAGPLPGDPALAEALIAHLHGHGVDAAVSYRMTLDHGLIQTPQLVFEEAALPPAVPVFINCAAPPRPPLARVVALGRAVGEFLRDRPERVLIIGSGGLSHDPPMPVLASAPESVRERLIEGGALSAEARARREAVVAGEGTAQASGQSARTPVNPAWDERILAALERFDFATLGALSDPEITHEGGCGGHEIRTWVATAAAVRAAGANVARRCMYRPIPVWVAGFGVMRFET